MSFVPSMGRAILVVEVTEDEYRQMCIVIEEHMELMNDPIIFPSRKGSHHCTMLLSAGLGCGEVRWSQEYLPQIESMFPYRIIHEVTCPP